MRGGRCLQLKPWSSLICLSTQGCSLKRATSTSGVDAGGGSGVVSLSMLGGERDRSVSDGHEDGREGIIPEPR